MVDHRILGICVWGFCVSRFSCSPFMILVDVFVCRHFQNCHCGLWMFKFGKLGNPCCEKVGSHTQAKDLPLLRWLGVGVADSNLWLIHMVMWFLVSKFWVFIIMIWIYRSYKGMVHGRPWEHLLAWYWNWIIICQFMVHKCHWLFAYKLIFDSNFELVFFNGLLQILMFYQANDDCLDWAEF